MIEKYLHTHDHQFGLKSQYATNMCILTVKSVTKYYAKQNSTVNTHFLMEIKLLILFSKMIKRNIPLVIVRIIAFWYQTQPNGVKWGKVN